MAHRNLQHSARELADRLVAVVGREDFDTFAGLVPRVISPQSPDHSLLRPVLTELLGEFADLVVARAGTVKPEDTFSIELNEDAEVDELPPPLRATVRAALAELNGDHDGAGLQLDFVAEDPDPCGRLDALVHLVSWVSELQ